LAIPTKVIGMPDPVGPRRIANPIKQRKR